MKGLDYIPIEYQCSIQAALMKSYT